jgi:hypothetical protein
MVEAQGNFMTIAGATGLGGGNPTQETKTGKQLIRDWNELQEHRKLHQERYELQRNPREGVREH